MATDITLFAAPQIAPAYLQTSPVAKAIQEQMEGGLAGRQINRISLRNGKFRFLKGGVEIVAVPEKLEVVMIAANPAVGRMWYEKPFDQDDTGQRPDCYSRDGTKPEADSPMQQSALCATCPQNAKGSAKDGKGKACAFKKRTIVVSPANIMGDPYALDLGSMTMFGDEQPANRRFNFKSYLEAIKSNGLIVPAVSTLLTFDDEFSVPKLLCTPVRVLTEAEFRQVETRFNDELVRGMLDEIDNKGEVGKPVNASPAVAAPTAPAATPAPATQPAQAPTPGSVPVQRRGRPAKVDTPPAAAPAPQAAPATVGFPVASTAPAAPTTPAATGFPPAAPAQAAPVASAAPNAAVPGFTVDLDGFDV